jgi:hypothetical protein
MKKPAGAALPPTHVTPHTHWYMNVEPVADEIVAAWLELVPTLDGLVMFTATNAENSLQWAYSNMASQGVMFLPDDPDI